MGNVKFIGELYKLNVLSSKILLRYIVTPLLHISLGKTDDSQEVQEMAVSSSFYFFCKQNFISIFLNNFVVGKVG